jgi:endonuclease YncB( thermonuclease family)
MKRLVLAAALLVMSGAAFAADTLPFIEDDYAKAVARAKARNLPIFVEAWAPW